MQSGKGRGHISLTRRLKDLEARFGFRLSGRLSQHFLVDSRILDRLVESMSVGPGDRVLEIGSGAGFLTERLLNAGAKVLAVEIDPKMVRALKHVIGFNPDLEIVEADVLKLDLPKLLKERHAGSWLAAGNLPYHITSPALFRLFDCCGRVEEGGARLARMVLMVQREVGARLAAKPGTRDYGALTVAAAYRAKVTRLFEIAPGAFLPPPRVRSMAVGFTPIPPALEAEQEKHLFALVKAAFGQRRKTLANAFSVVAGGKEEAARLLEDCGLCPKRRGETLAQEEFRALAVRLAGIITR